MEETAHKFAIHLIVLVHNFMEDLLVLNVRKKFFFQIKDFFRD